MDPLSTSWKTAQWHSSELQTYSVRDARSGESRRKANFFWLLAAWHRSVLLSGRDVRDVLCKEFRGRKAYIALFAISIQELNVDVICSACILLDSLRSCIADSPKSSLWYSRLCHGTCVCDCPCHRDGHRMEHFDRTLLLGRNSDCASTLISGDHFFHCNSICFFQTD